MEVRHGLKHEERKVRQLVHGEERVFPRKSAGEQQWPKDAGITSSIGEIERWFHHYMRKEASFLGVYQKNTKSESIIIRFKRNLPAFDGTWHTEDFMNWVDDIEDFFEEVNPPEHLKCEIILGKMEGIAYDWWKQLQYDRVMCGKERITLWPRMKNLLFSRFLPIMCSTECSIQVYNNNPVARENAPANEQSEERVEVKSSKCSTKCPNHLRKLEKEEEMKRLIAGDFAHEKCSMKASFQLHISEQKHVEEYDFPDELHYIGSIRDDSCKTQAGKATEETDKAVEHGTNEKGSFHPPNEINIPMATAFDKMLLDQLKETIIEGWEIGAEHATTVAVMVWNDGSRASNASFALKDVPKLGAYDADCLTKEMLICNFDPGGKLSNKPNGYHSCQYSRLHNFMKYVSLYTSFGVSSPLWVGLGSFTSFVLFGEASNVPVKYLFHKLIVAVDGHLKLTSDVNHLLKSSDPTGVVNRVSVGSDLHSAGSWHHWFQWRINRFTLLSFLLYLLPNLLNIVSQAFALRPYYKKTWNVILAERLDIDFIIGRPSKTVAIRLITTSTPCHSRLSNWFGNSNCLYYTSLIGFVHNSHDTNPVAMAQMVSIVITILASTRGLVDVTKNVGTLYVCTNVIWQTMREKQWVELAVQYFHQNTTTLVTYLMSECTTRDAHADIARFVKEIIGKDIQCSLKVPSVYVGLMTRTSMAAKFRDGIQRSPPFAARKHDINTAQLIAKAESACFASYSVQKAKSLVKHAMGLDSNINLVCLTCGEYMYFIYSIPGFISFCFDPGGVKKNDLVRALRQALLVNKEGCMERTFMEHVAAFILRMNIAASIIENMLYIPNSTRQMAWQEANYEIGWVYILEMTLKTYSHGFINYRGVGQHGKMHGTLIHKPCDEVWFFSEPWDYTFRITRGQVISWKGWNDEYNSNREGKLVMTMLSVFTISPWLSILWDNEHFRQTLKLFFKLVNGLDPPLMLMERL